MIYERTELNDKENLKFLGKKNFKKSLKIDKQVRIHIFKLLICFSQKKEVKEKKDPLSIFKFILNQNFDEKKKRSRSKEKVLFYFLNFKISRLILSGGKFCLLSNMF